MRYKIAECIIEYEPIYDMLKHKMEPYLYYGEKESDFHLTLNEEFCITKQKEHSHLTISECEYIFAGYEFYRKFILKGGFMLHASAVVVDGNAYLFSANSGVGKSTHTKQWQKYFGTDRALIINDDKPAIRKNEEGWFAYGTPFSGKTDENLNQKAKLQGICMLERGSDNKIWNIDSGKAITLLMQQTIVPRDPEMVNLLLTYLDILLAEVAIYQMQCTISEEAVKMAYEKMKGDII